MILKQLIEETFLKRTLLNYLDFQFYFFIFSHVAQIFTFEHIDRASFQQNFLFNSSSLYNKIFKNVINKKIDEFINCKNIYMRRILNNNLVNVEYNKEIMR